jgi:immunoglobulin-binding protein 1
LCPREGTSKTKATEIVARDEMQKLMQMAHQRNQKLQKYQQKKELDDQIKMLKVAMEREDVDEEIKRNFYLKLIKSCIWEAQDEIGSLEQEVEILQHISKMREDNPDSGKAKRPYKPVPLKPIIITKDALQKAVYGLGYPSLPTMTVKEFYDSRVAEGVFPSEEQLLQSSLQGRCEIDQEAEEEKANEQKELQVENDDPELLERARQMDDFKDDHRRGYGNRYNRS